MDIWLCFLTLVFLSVIAVPFVLWAAYFNLRSHIMATRDELNEAIDGLGTEIVEELGEVMETIEALEEKVTNGEDFSAEVAKLSAHRASIAGMVPDPGATPDPEPEPEPEPTP